MPRVLLCSMTVPWPDRPTQGQYHLDQAAALTDAGHPTSVLSPAPWIPRAMERYSAWAKRHANRPVSYRMRGIEIHSPRIPFVYPNTVRQRIAPAVPKLIEWYCGRMLTDSLSTTIEQTQASAILLHGMLPWGAAAKHIAHRHNVDIGVIEHSAGDVMRLRRNNTLGRHYARMAQHVKRIFVVNRTMKAHLEQELSLMHVALAINGVECPTVEQEKPARPKRFEGKTLVLSAAHYYRRKGFEELLTALAPQLRSREDLALAVITDRLDLIRQQALRLGVIDRLELLPLCSRAELMQWMSWADLFALPSWSESFGLVYAEAMHCGTPVLMSSDAGMSEELPQSSGMRRGPAWVVPPRDPHALSVAIHDATCDRIRLRRLGVEATRFIAGRFSWQRNAEVIATHLMG